VSRGFGGGLSIGGQRRGSATGRQCIPLLKFQGVAARVDNYQVVGHLRFKLPKGSGEIASDYKELLRDKESAIQFAEILDVFVSAGWPDAPRLVFRMDAAVR